MPVIAENTTVSPKTHQTTKHNDINKSTIHDRNVLNDITHISNYPRTPVSHSSQNSAHTNIAINKQDVSTLDNILSVKAGGNSTASRSVGNIKRTIENPLLQEAPVIEIAVTITHAMNDIHDKKEQIKEIEQLMASSVNNDKNMMLIARKKELTAELEKDFIKYSATIAQQTGDTVGLAQTVLDIVNSDANIVKNASSIMSVFSMILLPVSLGVDIGKINSDFNNREDINKLQEMVDDFNKNRPQSDRISVNALISTQQVLERLQHYNSAALALNTVKMVNTAAAGITTAVTVGCPASVPVTSLVGFSLLGVDGLIRAATTTLNKHKSKFIGEKVGNKYTTVITKPATTDMSSLNHLDKLDKVLEISSERVDRLQQLLIKSNLHTEIQKRLGEKDATVHSVHLNLLNKYFQNPLPQTSHTSLTEQDKEKLVKIFDKEYDKLFKDYRNHPNELQVDLNNRLIADMKHLGLYLTNDRVEKIRTETLSELKKMSKNNSKSFDKKIQDIANAVKENDMAIEELIHLCKNNEIAACSYNKVFGKNIAEQLEEYAKHLRFKETGIFLQAVANFNEYVKAERITYF